MNDSPDSFIKPMYAVVDANGKFRSEMHDSEIFIKHRATEDLQEYYCMEMEEAWESKVKNQGFRVAKFLVVEVKEHTDMNCGDTVALFAKVVSHAPFGEGDDIVLEVGDKDTFSTPEEIYLRRASSNVFPIVSNKES